MCGPVYYRAYPFGDAFVERAAQVSPLLPQTQQSDSIGMSRNSKRLQGDWSARSSWLPETVCRLNRFTAGV